MYTVAEFRKNIKKALDEVDRGGEVIIFRKGIMYNLVTNSPIKQQATKPDKSKPDDFVPRRPDPEMGYDCCVRNDYRCKHWQWDDMSVVWKNVITGKTKDE